MSSGLSTPVRSKNKIPQCENVEQEFSKRFMQVFTSFYETPSAEPLLTFPPVPKKKTTPKSDIKTKPVIPPPPFNAAVWDLRLKKAVEARQANDQHASESMTEGTVNSPENVSAKADLTDVFQPEKADRPETPKYLQNIEREQNKEIRERKNKKRSQPLNLSEVEKQFAQRMKKQKQRDEEHQKKLRDWQLQQEKAHKEFLNSLPKTRYSEEKASKDKGNTRTRKELLDSRVSAKNSLNRSKSPAPNRSNVNAPSRARSKSPARSPPKNLSLYSDDD